MKGPRLVVEPPQGTLAHREVRGTLADVESGHIRQVLEQAGWRVRGAGGAAERLGMKPTTLDSRMLKLGIRRPGAPK
jgi:transcriptional regulator with GAF, ATPase, and Fis domain